MYLPGAIVHATLLSQGRRASDLADQTGLSVRTIYNACCGNNTSRKTWAKIEEALGVTIWPREQQSDDTSATTENSSCNELSAPSQAATSPPFAHTTHLVSAAVADALIEQANAQGAHDPAECLFCALGKCADSKPTISAEALRNGTVTFSAEELSAISARLERRKRLLDALGKYLEGNPISVNSRREVASAPPKPKGLPVISREPTADERLGMTWWNGLNMAERRWVGSQADAIVAGHESSVADAWALWKAGRITMSPGRTHAQQRASGE